MLRNKPTPLTEVPRLLLTKHCSFIKCFIYPTNAQLDCSKNVKIYIKIYMRGAATCLGFSHPCCYMFRFFTPMLLHV